MKPVTAAGQTSIDVYFPGGENEVFDTWMCFENLKVFSHREPIKSRI